MRKVIIASIISALIVGACGRGDGAPSVASPDDLRGRLEAAGAIGKPTRVNSLEDLRARTSAAGLMCDTFPALNAQELKGIRGAIEGGFCDYGTPPRTTLLAVYPDDSVDAVLSSEATGAACARNDAETFATGVNWIISAKDASSVTSLARALGGQSRVVKCQDDGRSPTPISPDSVQAKIDAGIMCADYHTLDAPRFVDARARCTIDGDETTFLTFKDSEAKSDYLSGCADAQPSPHRVSGEGNWIIESTTGTTANALARALGTNVKTVECAKP